MYLPFHKQRLVMRLRKNPCFNQLYYFYIIQLLPEEIEGFFNELKTTQKLPLDYLLIEFEFIGNPNGYIRDRIRKCMLLINPSIHIEWMGKYCVISNTIISSPRYIPIADIQTHPTNPKSVVMTVRDLTLLYIPNLHSARNIFNSDFDLVVVFDKGERRINTPDGWVTLQYGRTQKCFVNRHSLYCDHLSDWVSPNPDKGILGIPFPDLRTEMIRNAHTLTCSPHRNRVSLPKTVRPTMNGVAYTTSPKEGY